MTMASASFSQSVGRVLSHEGGFSDHPDDPGGPTNLGITISVYRQHKPGATVEQLKRMSVFEAKGIYRERYWAALRCDEMPAGVDYTVFDYAVNSGIGRSGKVLRRVCGLPDDDWKVTDTVLSAVRARDAADIVRAINDERIGFLKRLKTWPSFGKGWARRVSDVRGISLALAGSGEAIRPVDHAPGKGEVPASPTGAIVKGGATATAGGSAWAWSQSDILAAAVIAAGLIAIGVALYLVHKRRRARQEAAAHYSVVPAIC